MKKQLMALLEYFMLNPSFLSSFLFGLALATFVHLLMVPYYLFQHCIARIVVSWPLMVVEMTLITHICKRIDK